MDGPDRSFTVAEFADRHRVHRATVHRWIALGLIRTYKLGGARRIPASEDARVTGELEHTGGAA